VTYDEYKARFYATVPLLHVPPDCKVGDPDFISSAPNVWHFRWVLEFNSDLHYIFCREAWSIRRGFPARRYMFSHHYGPGPTRSANGEIIFDHRNSVVLRCDKTNRSPAHIHFLSPDPHYEQALVQGLVIEDIDLFTFVSAVLQHRETGVAINQLLGFTVA
jgi:hypothetical protein